MCENHHRPRRGARLADGALHEKDHLSWSRRDFLSSLGLTAAAGAVALSGLPVRAFARTGLLERLASVETDRVLVIVQLSGGNDGLNTVIPHTNDLYFNARPNLAISDSLVLSDQYGLHPEMGGMSNLFRDGNLGIVHSVGYPDPVLSHFTSTDIWMTAGDGTQVPSEGWAGRYLHGEFPEYAETATDFPLAVQLGGAAPLMLQGPAAQMGVSIQSMDLFDRIAESAELYSTFDLPDSTLGTEMAFLRSVANDSFRYAESIQSASAAGSNAVEYTNDSLSSQLSAVARLIRGGLGSRIYHVSLGGFDTHAGQSGRHAGLLRDVSAAIASFFQDLGSDGWADRVLMMSFSEFGRRVEQNGSAGTDHGTAAPLFLAGPAVQGGFFGSGPELANLENGNLRFGTDFRSVYGSILKQWFGLPAADTSGILGGSFPDLALISSGTGTAYQGEPSIPGQIAISNPYPNPAQSQTAINYSLSRPESVGLAVFDILGRRSLDRTLGTRPAGTGRIDLDVSSLPPGSYIIRMTAGAATATTSLVVNR